MSKPKKFGVPKMENPPPPPTNVKGSFDPRIDISPEPLNIYDQARLRKGWPEACIRYFEERTKPI